MNAEIEQTLMLKQLLKNRIEQSDGWIPFDLFFNTIMYEPGLGYYSSGSHKIGEGGDFTTAPEISKYFSKAIARQTNRLLTMHDEPSIIEVGAGKGTFAFEYLKELEEAGIRDGQNWLGIIFKIILPLSLPAISSVALYVFMIAWNEFLFSLMFLDRPNTFTLSRAIQFLNVGAETPRQYLMAGSVIVTLPILIIFVYFEKFLVSGLTAGSVKG